MTLASTKMGLHEWAYSNNYDPVQRQKMLHVELPVRFAKMTTEVELGFTPEQTAAEVERCLNCDVQTHFTDSLCIECDACIDICPTDCLTITPERRRGGPARAAHRAGHRAEPGAVRVRRPEADGTRDGEGRERLPPLRPVRRALPDLCVGHAEVRRSDSAGRPVAAGESVAAALHGRSSQAGSSSTRDGYLMDRVNDFAFKIATANGTGSASANGLIMQAIFRMGVPVTGKNVFPSNIQGLPTWYEIRVNKNGYTARTPQFDLMVALERRHLRQGRGRGALRRLAAVRLVVAARRAAAAGPTSPTSACRWPRCATRRSRACASAS